MTPTTGQIAPAERYCVLSAADRTRAAKVRLFSVAARRNERVRVDHEPNLLFCFCILTLAHFGHFHFRCWW
jgi:hypothetical protein